MFEGGLRLELFDLSEQKADFRIQQRDGDHALGGRLRLLREKRKEEAQVGPRRLVRLSNLRGVLSAGRRQARGKFRESPPVHELLLARLLGQGPMQVPQMRRAVERAAPGWPEALEALPEMQAKARRRLPIGRCDCPGKTLRRQPTCSAREEKWRSRSRGAGEGGAMDLARLWALFAADAFDKTAAIAAAGLGSKRGRGRRDGLDPRGRGCVAALHPSRSATCPEPPGRRAGQSAGARPRAAWAIP